MESSDGILVSMPSVCLAGDEYQIMQPVSCPTLMWAEIGGNKYYDESNGILRSSVKIHRIRVPQEVLDSAGQYTLCYRKIIERKVYFPTSEDTVKQSFSFRPVKDSPDINIVMIADSHGMTEPSVAFAGRADGPIDLLILNGDIADHSGTEENISIAYKIAGAVTKGEIPVVMSRGNHDMRGALAENLADFTPNDGGRVYYTFRAGPVWGIVLDCGEDKLDSEAAYGFTICCHEYRLRETEFIKKVINEKSSEYEAAGVKYRLVISHVPFCYDNREPDANGEILFDIENDVYKEWAGLLKEYVKPDLMLTGHMHYLAVCPPGGRYDNKGQPCTCVIGSAPDFAKRTFTGTEIKLHDSAADVLFISDAKGCIKKETVKLK